MDFRRNTTDYAKAQTSGAVGVDQGLRSYMLRIYNYMASGLALTGIVALFAAQSDTFMGMLYNFSPEGYPIGMSLFGYVIAFSPLVAVLALSFGINRMSAATAQLCFWGFAFIMGLSMTGIFLAYTGESIARTFFVTAGTFGAMSIYGYTTKKDLTGFGSFLIMGVWGLILASIVNMFMQSTALGFAISAIGVLIFTGLTAYDTQRLKSLYYQISGNGEALAKASIMGALNLYLDFINLFIMLLRFMGDRR